MLNNHLDTPLSKSKQQRKMTINCCCFHLRGLSIVLAKRFCFCKRNFNLFLVLLGWIKRQRCSKGFSYDPNCSFVRYEGINIRPLWPNQALKTTWKRMIFSKLNNDCIANMECHFPPHSNFGSVRAGGIQRGGPPSTWPQWFGAEPRRLEAEK